MALLEEKGITPTVIHYLETPPSADELMKIVGMLGGPATQLVRFKENLAKELGLAGGDTRSDQQWCDLLAANPSLIERPIVVRDQRAAIGRPLDNIVDIL